MANLNLATVELVSTLRAAPLNGATVSQDYNDSWTEALADLASLSGFLNDIVIPILDGLSSTIQPISNGAVSGLEGRFIFSDTTDTTPVFFDLLSNQPNTIAGSLRVLNGIVSAVQTLVATLNVEVAALQTQLSTSSQNDVAQALQNFAASLTSLTNQVNANTITLQTTLITLQTNGVDNAVQNKLNLVAGSNVTVVNTPSSGDVTISATGLVLTTKTQVSAAQIKSLRAIPVQLVPTPAAGLFIQPKIVVFSLHFGGVIYGNLGVSNLALRLGVNNWNGAAPVQLASGLLNQVSDGAIFLDTQSTLSGSFQLRTVLEALPLNLINDGPSEFTLGNGTLTITVYYIIVPLD